MIDFLIFYEIKNREFESIVLLRNELEKRGYVVEFFSFFENRNYSKCKLFFNKVRIAVMPSLYHNEEILQFVYRVAGKVENIINLRWEQVFTHHTELDMNYYVYPKQLAREAYNCCWGVKTKSFLQKLGIPSEKSYITGPIQMDLLRKSFRKYYLCRDELFSKYNISTNKKCVLFISSFSVSTFSTAEKDLYLSQFSYEERTHVEAFIKNESLTRRFLADWLLKIVRTYDCTIVYRPHPTEIDNPELIELKKEANVKVISDENVKQWILCCDHIYTWYSTSFSEAFFAKKRCDILRPLAIRYEDDLPIYDGLSFITNVNQLTDNYNKYLNDYKDLCINDYYDFDPIIPSYIRTIDFFEKVINSNNRFPWNKFRFYEFFRINLLCVKDEFLCYLYDHLMETNIFFCKLAKFIPFLQSKKNSWDSYISNNKKKIISYAEFANTRSRLFNCKSQNK